MEFIEILKGDALAAALPCLAVLVLALLLFARPRPWLASIHGKPLMTPNEVEFYHRLRRALPSHHVFPQVCFGAFLTVDRSVSDKQRRSIRGRFGQKYADFVICDGRSLAILAVVELDDATHDAAKDRERDRLVAAGGYRTLRFESRRKPTVNEIAALFGEAAA